MSDVMTDRRAAPRYSLILLAEVTDRLSSAKFTARTSDVSRTGCYLDTLNPLPRGTQVQLRLRNQKELFECGAIVRYVSPGLGMGVQFEEIPTEQLERLDRWLTGAAKSSR
jgi:PilZ domain